MATLTVTETEKNAEEDSARGRVPERQTEAFPGVGQRVRGAGNPTLYIIYPIYSGIR